MHWGDVEVALKDGVPPDRVLNAMKLPKLLQERSGNGGLPIARHTTSEWSLASKGDPIVISGNHRVLGLRDMNPKPK